MAQQPKIVDFEDALKRTIGDVALLQILHDDFHQILPDFLFRFRKAFENNAMAQLSKDAHQLKGAAGNLSVGKIMAAAILLEQTAKQNNVLEAQDALNRIETAIAEYEKHMDGINWADIAP